MSEPSETAEEMLARPLAFLGDRTWPHSERVMRMLLHARGFDALGIGLALAGLQVAIDLGAGAIGEHGWIVVICRYENSSSHCR